MRMRQILAVSIAWICVIGQVRAEQPFVARPKGPVVWRPYKMPAIPPVQLVNSDRLHRLIQAGKLYLTLQDAIALAIENNLDLAVDRYGPLSAEWDLQRQQAGGPLKGVTSGNSFVNQIAAGQGVEGALQSAGLSPVNTTSGGNGTNAVIAQIGPITPNLDMVFQNSSAWSHTTSPQANLQISQTDALINASHRFGSFIQQGLLSGGFVQIAADESYLNQNSPTDVINPSFAPVVQFYVRHNLLSGFGTGVNSRFIRVAQKQVTASSEIFRSQLLNLVANVVNMYWDLVSDEDDLRAKQNARDFAEKFYQDIRYEASIGAIAGFQVYRAQEEYSTRTQDVQIARATVQRQEVLLKNALSRNGLEDPLLDEAEVVTLDRIEVPESDDLPPLRELVTKALAQRPDIALSKIGDETREISAEGTANGVRPSLQGIVSTTLSANTGEANPLSPQAPDPRFVGGLGTALGQVFGRDFVSRRTGIIFQGTIQNRIAQGDYGIDQLQLQQNTLLERKQMNQLVVDISNQVVALRQARSRYSLAADTRALQEQLLEKAQQQFSLGDATTDDIIAAERSLTAAQYSEVAALSSYSRARVALDQVLGQTLETNHVSIEEAVKGQVARESILPEPAVSRSAAASQAATDKP